MLRQRKFKELEKALGHRFKKQTLLEIALTHASMRGGKDKHNDNERFEFIGDRVLGLAIAELLSERFPDASEGELARRYNRLVRGETCAKVARALSLGTFLILSDSEAGSGGRAKGTILADAMEALLGAIFLDAGYDKARDAVWRLWETPSDEMQTTAAARRQVGAAGVGPGAGARTAGVCRGGAQGSRPRAALHLRGAHNRQEAGARGGGVEAHGRAGGGAGDARAGRRTRDRGP